MVNPEKMKKIANWSLSLVGLIALLSYSCNSRPDDRDSDLLAKPSAVQYKWQEQERIMFVCLDPCTWQGREYDNHSTPLERINPEKLDTDQWCEVAQSWGAREILFVAKHTGGFCWWQTETTDYGIKNTPYKDGKGDVLQELSESCRKYGLHLGIYVYPGDETWGAGIGSGGLTKDPTKQEAYNQVFRQQLTETLSRYGEVLEVWFDGSCMIDVSDILETYAKNAVIFQGPHATLRWPGTESGKLFYPAWNTLSAEDMETGVATQVHGDPDGEVWAPLETNTTLYDHNWFWAPQNELKRKSLEQIMECYYKSVGYGSVFLLNSTPDTTGLIPAGDVDFYRAFGREIDRRFKTPIASVMDQKGSELTLEMPDKQLVNHVVIMEDYREGHRIRNYTIEGLQNGQWIELVQGQSVGRMKIDFFPEVELSQVRLTVDKSVGEPLLRKMAVFHVTDFNPYENHGIRPWSQWQQIASWDESQFQGDSIRLEIDLSDWIRLPGQYAVHLVPDSTGAGLEITHGEIHYEGRKALPEFLQFSGASVNINRTAQVTDESQSLVYLSFKSREAKSGKIEFRPAIIY